MTAIAANISLTLSGSLSPLRAVVSYDDRDPVAVSITFCGETGKEDVTWVFARSILIDGFRSPSGVGDIRVWPENAAWIVIRLESPDGTATLRTPAVPLQSFVQDSLDLVPKGKELDHLDIDTALERLLAD